MFGQNRIEEINGECQAHDIEPDGRPEGRHDHDGFFPDIDNLPDPVRQARYCGLLLVDADRRPGHPVLDLCHYPGAACQGCAEPLLFSFLRTNLRR